MSWLLDTDVICQPAKKNGEPKVIAWLEAEQDRCYTSAVVIAQLAYWVRTKEGRQRQTLQAWLTRLVNALHGRIHGFNVSVAHVGRSRTTARQGRSNACRSRTVTSRQPHAGTPSRSSPGTTETSNAPGLRSSIHSRSWGSHAVRSEAQQIIGLDYCFTSSTRRILARPSSCIVRRDRRQHPDARRPEPRRSNPVLGRQFLHDRCGAALRETDVVIERADIVGVADDTDLQRWILFQQLPDLLRSTAANLGLRSALSVAP